MFCFVYEFAFATCPLLLVGILLYSSGHARKAALASTCEIAASGGYIKILQWCVRADASGMARLPAYRYPLFLSVNCAEAKKTDGVLEKQCVHWHK